MFLRFLLCSGLAAAVNLAVGYLLYGLAGWDGPVSFVISVALAFGAGMSVSFVLNRRFTFPASGRRKRQELRDFFFVSLGGLALTSGIAQAVYRGAPWLAEPAARAMGPAVLPETVAHVIAVGLTAIYSFFAHRYISFRRAASGSVAAQSMS